MKFLKSLSLFRLAGTCLALVGMQSLAACNSTGGFAPVSVQSVQQALSNVCGYELLASTAAADISAVVGTLGPAATAIAVADAICKVAVRSQPATSDKAGITAAPAKVLTVNGVAVHGGFVNPNAGISGGFLKP